MRLFKFLPLLFIMLASCKQYLPTQYSYKDSRNVDSTVTSLAKIENIIRPYKTALDKEMNVVIGYADTMLIKTQPESDLGNWMCDVMLAKSKDYYKADVDFTFLNHGGIRLPSLAKGDITYGKMIELMPFDNRIVIMQIKGTTIDSLFNHMASKGGWHVSKGTSYAISNGRAFDIRINGEPLKMDRIYTLAVSDYLAQGGDNCTMLKGIPYIDTRKTLRDALIEGLKEATARGEHVRSIIEGRVIKLN